MTIEEGFGPITEALLMGANVAHVGAVPCEAFAKPRHALKTQNEAMMRTAIKNGYALINAMDKTAKTDTERMRAETLLACFTVLSDELKAQFPQLAQ